MTAEAEAVELRGQLQRLRESDPRRELLDTRERLRLAEQALERAGFVRCEGPFGWKPPIDPQRGEPWRRLWVAEDELRAIEAALPPGLRDPVRAAGEPKPPLEVRVAELARLWAQQDRELAGLKRSAVPVPHGMAVLLNDLPRQQPRVFDPRGGLQRVKAPGGYLLALHMVEDGVVRVTVELDGDTTLARLQRFKLGVGLGWETTIRLANTLASLEHGVRHLAAEYPDLGEAAASAVPRWLDGVQAHERIKDEWREMHAGAKPSLASIKLWPSFVDEARRADAAHEYIDVVCEGPPGPESGRFVEVEDATGASIRAGEWIDRGDGTWGLRIAVGQGLVAPPPTPCAVSHAEAAAMVARRRGDRASSTKRAPEQGSTGAAPSPVSEKQEPVTHGAPQ